MSGKEDSFNPRSIAYLAFYKYLEKMVRLICKLPMRIVSDPQTAVVAVGGVLAIFQYSQSVKWQKAQLLSAEITRFENATPVRDAIALMDFPTRPLVLEARKGGDGKQLYVTVGSNILQVAMMHDQGIVYGLNKDSAKGLDPQLLEKYAAIQKTFDDYFTFLEQFWRYRESGLMDDEYLRDYLEYWLGLMGVGNYGKDAQLGEAEVGALWAYALDNDFGNLEKLARLVQKDFEAEKMVGRLPGAEAWLKARRDKARQPNQGCCWIPGSRKSKPKGSGL